MLGSRRGIGELTEHWERKGQGNMKRKVIIDCDPGIDDSLALMLALTMEEIQVAGVTIVCGN